MIGEKEMSSVKQKLLGLLPEKYIKSLEERFDGDYKDILAHLENEYYVGYQIAEDSMTGREWSSLMPSHNKDQAKLYKDMWLKCAAIRKQYFPEGDA